MKRLGLDDRFSLGVCCCGPKRARPGPAKDKIATAIPKRMLASFERELALETVK